MRNERAFSLLEVLIALAIITVVAASVYIMQSTSLFSSVRTKNMMIASNLARSFLAKSELELEAKDFATLEKKEEGKFTAPYETYKWTREIKEQDFSAIAMVVKDAQMGMQAAEEASGTAKKDANDNAENANAAELVSKVFANYLADSIRTMKITILWTEDGKEKSISFTTLLVRYDAQFRATL